MSIMRDTNFLDRYGDTNHALMSEIVRYNNRLKVRQEDLAQHSFFVAYYVILVGNDYKIPSHIVNEACVLAILHDYPEKYTLDLAHDLKYKYKDIKVRFEEIERDYIADEAPELLGYYDDLDKDNIQSLLVKIGDALSVLLYTNREFELGNSTKDMKIISNEIKVRLTELFNRLESKLNIKE